MIRLFLIFLLLCFTFKIFSCQAFEDHEEDDEVKTEESIETTELPPELTVKEIDFERLLSQKGREEVESTRDAESLKYSNEPLYVTPMIESFKPGEARERSRVFLASSTVSSYSGFVTVDKGVHLFFWFFPAVNQGAQLSSKRPLILWMEGSPNPGVSSLFTLFNGNGPFVIHANGSLLHRQFTWSNFSNVVYLDVPAGSGFSHYTDTPNLSRPLNLKVISKDISSFLDQFFWMFPELQECELYLAGSTFAAKYATLSAANNRGDPFINLKGILLTNPWISPVTQIDYYADYFYQSGLINAREYNYFKKEQNRIKYFVRRHDYQKAYQVYDELIAGKLMDNKTYFQTVTGYVTLNNILDITHPAGFDNYINFLQREDIKRALHVKGIDFKANNIGIVRQLSPEYFVSMDEELADVMSRYRVLLMSGNLDILIPVSSVSRSVNSIKWKCQEDLKNADKEIGLWSVDERDIIGHLTTACDVYIVIVRNAGSNVIYDQQEITYTLTEMFTNVSLPFEV
jgi:vitellogenic carboxypeptidase-like protein